MKAWGNTAACILFVSGNSALNEGDYDEGRRSLKEAFHSAGVPPHARARIAQRLAISFEREPLEMLHWIRLALENEDAEEPSGAHVLFIKNLVAWHCFPESPVTRGREMEPLGWRVFGALPAAARSLVIMEMRRLLEREGEFPKPTGAAEVLARMENVSHIG